MDATDTNQTRRENMNFSERLQQYQNGSEMDSITDGLAYGWEIVVWPDGKAMLLSPRTSPQELGEGAIMDSAEECRDLYQAEVSDL